METTRYPLWKSIGWSMASGGYAAMVTGLSLWVMATFRCVLSSWAAIGIVVAALALLWVGYRRAAKHGLRMYKYVLGVTIGSVLVLVLYSSAVVVSLPVPRCL